MPSANESIWWDPTTEQISQGEGDWVDVATDGPVRLRRKESNRRWLLQVVGPRGGVIASAICFSSATLGTVAAEFKSIAEVL